MKLYKNKADFLPDLKIAAVQTHRMIANPLHYDFDDPQLYRLMFGIIRFFKDNTLSSNEWLAILSKRNDSIGQCARAVQQYVAQGYEYVRNAILAPETVPLDRWAYMTIYAMSDTMYPDRLLMEYYLKSPDHKSHGNAFLSLIYSKSKKLQRDLEMRQIIPQYIHFIQNDYPDFFVRECRDQAVEVLGEIANMGDSEVILLLEKIAQDGHLFKSNKDRKESISQGKIPAIEALQKIRQRPPLNAPLIHQGITTLHKKD